MRASVVEKDIDLANIVDLTPEAMLEISLSTPEI
jgi:hypothetical protein